MRDVLLAWKLLALFESSAHMNRDDDGGAGGEDDGLLWSRDLEKHSYVSDTELVRRAYELRPKVASTGPCCLVQAIWNWKGMLYTANLGNSRAVVGTVVMRIGMGQNPIDSAVVAQDLYCS